MRESLRVRFLEFISQLQHLLAGCIGGKLADCSKGYSSPCVKWDGHSFYFRGKCYSYEG